MAEEEAEKAELRRNIPFQRRLLRFAVTAAAVCLFTFISVPVLAGNIPAVYRLMYLVSPEAAQFFMPVQKADEYDGIRKEVVSAYIHDDTAEIYITMQDLTRDRLDNTIDLYESYFINTPFDCSATCWRVGYDEETKTVTFLITIEQWGERKIEGDKITFSVRGFLSHKEEYEALPIPIELEEEAPEIMETRLTGGGKREWSINKNSARVLVPGAAD